MLWRRCELSRSVEVFSKRNKLESELWVFTLLPVLDPVYGVYIKLNWNGWLHSGDVFRIPLPFQICEIVPYNKTILCFRKNVIDEDVVISTDVFDVV